MYDYIYGFRFTKQRRASSYLICVCSYDTKSIVNYQTIA